MGHSIQAVPAPGLGARRSRRVLGMLLFGIAGAACAEASTAPFPIPTSLYAADHLVGGPLPVLLHDEGATRLWLEYVAVSFERDETALLVRSYRQEMKATGALRVLTDQARYSVRVKGDTVQLLAACSVIAAPPCGGGERVVRSGNDFTFMAGHPVPTTIRLVRR